MAKKKLLVDIGRNGRFDYAKVREFPCLILGKISMCNGERGIYPYRCGTREAIEKCTQGSIDSTVILQNGVIEVTSVHKDDVARFKIYALSEHGMEKTTDGKHCRKSMIPKSWVKPIAV